MHPEEAAFQARLDADPSDHLTRLVFADWLQDREDKRAEGYRAIVLYDCRLRPNDWNWWNQTSYAASGYKFPHYTNPRFFISNSYAPAMLPYWWFNLLPGFGTNVRSFFSRQEAEDAAAIAYSKADKPLNIGD